MRILHLLASPVYTGPAENVALLALAQRALGHEVSIAVDRKRPGLQDEEPIVPRLRAHGLLDEGGLELSVKSWPWTMVKDSRTLRRRVVDVVHSHFTHDHFIARFGRPRAAVLIRSVHAPRSLKGLLRAQGYTVCSEQDARWVAAAPHRVLRALVSPDFQPAPDRAAWQSEQHLSGEPVVGMVSHFQPSRRHALGLRAFAELVRVRPKARLVLVGDGPERPAVESLARTLSVDRQVTFTGYLSGAAFVRVLQALEVVWLLGLGNDFTARAARQARDCGARVVGVDEGALSLWADTLVPLTAEAIAIATLEVRRREVPEPSNEDIAREMIDLYHEARSSPPRSAHSP